MFEDGQFSRAVATLAAGALLLGAATPALATEGETIALSGKISADMRYRLRIDYATTVNDRACQFEDQITGLWIRQLESRYEQPRIDGDTHQLTAAVARPGGPGACEWRPSVVYICVGPRSAADEAMNCRSLFVVTPFASRAAATLSLRCEPKFWNCITADGKDPTQQVNGVAGDIRLDIESGELKPAS